MNNGHEEELTPGERGGGLKSDRKQKRIEFKKERGSRQRLYFPILSRRAIATFVTFP